MKKLSWVFRIVAALILLQTLYFKFTAAPESVFIFTQLGIEPYGRITVGVAELIASLLLLVPKSRSLGALMGIGLMLGAIAGHLTKLGIEVMNDGGYLFALSLVVLVSCVLCLYLERKQLTSFIKRVFTSR